MHANMTMSGHKTRLGGRNKMSSEEIEIGLHHFFLQKKVGWRGNLERPGANPATPEFTLHLH
jgi:hypothetical protein